MDVSVTILFRVDYKRAMSLSVFLGRSRYVILIRGMMCWGDTRWPTQWHTYTSVAHTLSFEPLHFINTRVN